MENFYAVPQIFIPEEPYFRYLYEMESGRNKINSIIYGFL
jgi:hypothetical protein